MKNEKNQMKNEQAVCYRRTGRKAKCDLKYRLLSWACGQLKNGHNSQNFCTKDLGLGSKFTSSHILQWPSSLELFQKAFWVLIFIYAQIRRKKIKAKIFFNTLKKFLVHPNLLGIFLAMRAMPRGKFRAQSEVSSVKIEWVMPV